MVELAALLGLMALFFLWGFFVARARGRSGIMWGLACALTAFIGIAILYSLGDHRRPVSRDNRPELIDDRAQDQAEVQGQELAAALPPPAFVPPPALGDDKPDDRDLETPIMTGESADDRRWRYLCEYHPDVRKAVSAVSLLGEDALAELKAAHLAVNDPSVLPAIVQRLGERFGTASAPKRNGAIKTHGNGASQISAVSNVNGVNDADDEEPLTLDTPLTPREWPRNALSRDKELAPTVDAYVAPAQEAPPSADRSLGRAARIDPPPPPPVKEQPGTAALDNESKGPNVGDEPIETAASLDPVEPIDDAEPIAGGATKPRAEEPASSASAPQALRKAADRTVVTPTDLQGAKFLETYAGVHLFGLADGRVFIDRHEARGSLDLARNYVDQLASRRLNS